jgi:hypothetical protein
MPKDIYPSSKPKSACEFPKTGNPLTIVPTAKLSSYPYEII